MYGTKLNLQKLTELLREAVRKGCNTALTQNSHTRASISKANAYRLYGRRNVDRWISEGLIGLLPDQGRTPKKCLSRKKLDAIAAASNRMTYLPVAER